MALESGRPPLRLLDAGLPDSWSELDLEILSQWKHMKEVKCPGCQRTLSQHLHNPALGREESPEDYMPYSIDCPAQQAIAQGQHMWKQANKAPLDRYHKDSAADPGQGVYWIAQGHNEMLPQPQVD